MVRLAAVMYAGMALFALLLNAIRGATLVPFETGPKLLPACLAALLGAGAALVVSAFGVARWRWAADLQQALRARIGTLSFREVLFLALASGTAEEMLFRGAVQPLFVRRTGSEAAGLLIATLVFAALHTGMDRALRPWAPFAFVMGLFLGALTLLSGSILPAVLCHVLVNAVNLRRMTR